MKLDRLDQVVLEAGTLSAHGLPELLGLVFSRRETGELKVVRGRQKTEIYFLAGLPAFARTSGSGLTILDVMAREKRLTPEDALQVQQLCRDKGIDIGECLKLLFEVSESQLYYFWSETIKEIIVNACGFKEGEYVFTPSESLLESLPMYDLNPLELIYLGMTRRRRADMFQDLHALTDRKVKLNPEPHDFFLLPGPLYEHSHVLDLFAKEIPLGQAIGALHNELGEINLALQALHLFILTRLLVFVKIPADEIIESVSEICKPSEKVASPTSNPLEKEWRVKGTDSALPSTDYIITRPRRGRKAKDGLGPTDEAARESPESLVTERAPSPARGDRVEIAPATGSVKKAVPAPPARTVPSKPSREAEFEELRSRLQAWAGRIEMSIADYDLLGVSVEDDAAEIQESYLELSREFDEAKLPADLPADLGKAAAAIREKLEQVSVTLADPARRLEYERELARVEKSRAYKLPMRQALAKKMAARGHWYLRHHGNEGAREFFEQALELDARQASSYMHLGWAIFRSPDGGRDEARGYLLSALEIDPQLARANYYLGLIAKQEGAAEEAERRFRQALELDPDDRPSQRELAFLLQRQKQTGLWQKLFGGK